MSLWKRKVLTRSNRQTQIRTELDPADIVHKFAPTVYRHLKRIFGPQADVDDVYQTVFVEILRSLRAFKGEAHISTYIRRITWNVAYQEMRHNYRHKALTFLGDTEPHGSEHVDAEQRTDDHRNLHTVYAALAMLEPKQRTVVLMHDIEEHTLKEIAETLGRPNTTVASQLYAGRKQLSKLVHDKRCAREPFDHTATKHSKGKRGLS